MPDFFLQFVSYRGGFIVNQEAIEQYGESYSENAVGSGAYTLETWSPRNEIVLRKNADYYGAEPYFDVMRYAIILEEAVLEVALERGEIDIFTVTDPIVALSVLANPNLKTERFLAERNFTAYINTERPPFDDARVRRALWYALDKDVIVEAGFQGLARANDTVLGEHIPNRLATTPYTYDPEYARQLLEEADFDFDTVIEMPMDERGALVQPIMQAQWAEIGVRSVTPLVERLQHVDIMTAGDFDIAVRTVSRATADQVFSWYFEESNIPYPAASRYRNPELQALLEELRVTVDSDRLREVAYRIQEIVHEEAPVIPLVNVEWVLAMRPSIEGAFPGVYRVHHETIRRVE
jgi:ABC-type transport system substrate-binding protein